MAGTDSISRQDTIDRINKQREHLRPDVFPQDAIGDAAYRACAEFIERLPSAERTGEWLHPYKSDVACECSVCHKQMPITDWFHFCPNCGSGNTDKKKRKEKENEEEV